MQFLVLPMRNDLPFYQYKIALSATQFTLVMRFNGRMNRWILDVNDQSGNPILSGIPVLIRRNLTGQYAYLAVPQGTLFALDDTGQDTQPTQFSFGLDHTVWYADPTL
jgi:hypothetical protein